tara:strand:+ start:339 stop:503 length:165 start_codon:yes stop_codon:yes gene_type:complete
MNEQQKMTYITTILAGYINDGMPVDQAIDMVLGEGSYKRMADELHDEFNKDKND